MRRSSLCVLIAFAVVSALVAIELPDPPPGFSWHEVRRFKGAFLVPIGWHVSEEQEKGTLAYFITEQPFTPPTVSILVRAVSGRSILCSASMKSRPRPTMTRSA